MKTNKFLLYAVACVTALALTITSCSKEDDAPLAPEPTLAVDGTADINAPAGGGVYVVNVASNTVWSVMVSEASTWCAVTPLSKEGDGEITITVTANEANTPRTASLLIMAGEATNTATTINVAQEGCSGIIFLEGYTGAAVSVTYKDGTGAANLTKNADNKVYLPAGDQDKIIRGIALEGFDNPILIGRKVDGSVVALKVDGTRLAFREAIDGAVPVGSMSELQRINTALAGVYKQEAHLDLLDEPFTPIGLQITSTPFEGLFDGNDFTLANLKIDLSESPDIVGVGLFGWNYGTVTNVHVVSGSVKGTDYVGGICGYNGDGGGAVSALISNCTNAATVEGAELVGGICGTIDYHSVVEHCSNAGHIKGTGIYVGGIFGYYEGWTLTDCHNTGEVTGESAYVGGICGYADGEIVGCSNAGAVSGGYYVGGICGEVDMYGYTDLNYTIYLCSNSGAISAEMYAGGIVGYNLGIVYACYNTGNISGVEEIGGIVGEHGGYLTACYNTGNISGTEQIGGVCGKLAGAAISACYNNGTITGETWVGGVHGAGMGYYFYASYNVGAVYGEPRYVGGIAGLYGGGGGLYDDGGYFWRDVPDDDAIYGVSYFGTDNDAYYTKKFSATDWPSTANHSQWGIGNGQDADKDYYDGCGEEGVYWKDLGSWNNGNPVYPTLWFENAATGHSLNVKKALSATRNDRSALQKSKFVEQTERPGKKSVSEKFTK
jgi:hypothetical protein